MNKEMELIFKGSNPQWEQINQEKIIKIKDTLINGVKVQSIPDPSYIPVSLISYKTIHSELHFEFKYPQKTYDTITIFNRFGIFKIDKHDKNIVEITFYTKHLLNKWVSLKKDNQSHNGIIAGLILDNLEKL